MTTFVGAGLHCPYADCAMLLGFPEGGYVPLADGAIICKAVALIKHGVLMHELTSTWSMAQTQSSHGGTDQESLCD